MDKKIKINSLKKVISEHSYLADNTYNPEGIFSEIIFGPVKSFMCSCGKKSTNKQIKYCPKCYVEYISNISRYERFGRIETFIPLIKNIKKIKFIKNEFKHIIDPYYFDKNQDQNIYLQINNDDINLTNSFNYEDCIPLNITGNVSLYLALKVAEKKNIPNIKDYLGYFTFNIIVLPPNSRNDLIDRNNPKSIIPDKINKKYNALLHYINFKNKDGDLNKFPDNLEKYIDTILGLKKPVRNIFDINMLDHTSSRIQIDYDKLKLLMIAKNNSKNGDIRHKLLASVIDYSARSVVIPNPSLRVHQIILPKKIFVKLFFLEYQHYLKKYIYKSDYKTLPKQELLYSVNVSESIYDIDKLPYIDKFIDWFFNTSHEIDRLVLVNRQPTVWYLNMNSLEVIGINNKNAIEINKHILSHYNGDYDGDEFAIYKVHDKNAKKELYEKSYIKKIIQYNHNEEFIHSINNEAKYAFDCIKNTQISFYDRLIKIKKISDLPENSDLLKHCSTAIQFNNKIYSYGIVLLNKWCKFDEIIITNEFNIKKLLPKIYDIFGSNLNYYQFLVNDVFNKLLWMSTFSQVASLTVPFNDAIDIINMSKQKLKIFKNLPSNPHVGFNIYKGIIDSCYSDISDDSGMKKLAFSNRKTKEAIPKSVFGFGYIADHNNIVQNEPISSSMINGQTEDEFFRAGSGTRKGFCDKEGAVPKSGDELRAQAMACSFIVIKEDDCGSKYGLNFKIENNKIIRSKIGQYFYNPKINEWVVFQKEHIEEYLNSNIVFRSPIMCGTEDFGVCKKCIGDYKFINKIDNIGVMAAMMLNENIFQLAMSSFHTSGSANLKVNDILTNLFSKKLNDIVNFENEFDLLFNEPLTGIEIDECKNLPGFIDINDEKNKIKFKNIYDVINEDVTADIDEVSNILKTENYKKNNLISIEKTYTDFLNILLKYDDIYSVFAEIILCNLFFTKNTPNDKNEEGVLLRYRLKNLKKGEEFIIFKKYGIRNVHKVISPLVNLLFNANKTSIQNYRENHQKDTGNSIFEKIWNNNL